MGNVENRHIACGVCGNLVEIVDYDDGAGRGLPTLYLCGICHNWMREDDKRLVGKCVVCGMMFKDWKGIIRCKNHVRWWA